MSNTHLVATETCPACQGDGINRISYGGAGENPVVVEGECERCGGTGIHTISDIGYVGNIHPTYEILEATNATEYTSLSPGNLALYNLIISAGSVDLSSGTIVKTVLWAMFGEGSATRASLDELIG
jgi:hypothetical protein